MKTFDSPFPIERHQPDGESSLPDTSECVDALRKTDVYNQLSVTENSAISGAPRPAEVVQAQLTASHAPSAHRSDCSPVPARIDEERSIVPEGEGMAVVADLLTTEEPATVHQMYQPIEPTQHELSSNDPMQPAASGNEGSPSSEPPLQLPADVPTASAETNKQAVLPPVSPQDAGGGRKEPPRPPAPPTGGNPDLPDDDSNERTQPNSSSHTESSERGAHRESVIEDDASEPASDMVQPTQDVFGFEEHIGWRFRQVMPPGESEREMARIPDSEFIERTLKVREMISLEEIAEGADEGDGGSEQAADLLQMTAESIARMATGRVLNQDALIEQVDILHSLYAALDDPDVAVSPELAVLGTSLNSFEAFVERFMPSADKSIQALLKSTMRFYTENILNHPRTLRLSDPPVFPQRFGIYDHHGTWYRVPGSSRDRVYIEQQIIEEIASLHAQGFPPDNTIYHATGSVALEGIGQEGAILSALAAIRLGHATRTGEQVEWLAPGQALDAIFAAPELSMRYTLVHWFNEYPVVFGLANDRTDHLERQPDEILLHPRVPTNAITSAYTYSRFVPVLQAWMDAYCPEPVRVVSLEAALNYKDVIRHLDEIRQSTPITLS